MLAAVSNGGSRRKPRRIVFWGSTTTPTGLQRLEEYDQRLLVFRRQLQPEFVAEDRTGAAMVALRYVILLEARWVQPLLQLVGTPGMTKAIAKPDTAERGDFIESGATSRLHRQHGVGSHRDIQDVLGLAEIVRNLEAGRRGQFIARI